MPSWLLNLKDRYPLGMYNKKYFVRAITISWSVHLSHGYQRPRQQNVYAVYLHHSVAKDIETSLASTPPVVQPVIDILSPSIILKPSSSQSVLICDTRVILR